VDHGRVFDYRDHAEWLPRVAGAVGSLGSDGAVDHPVVWSEEWPWTEDQGVLLRDRIFSHYDSIRAGHGARPEDVGSYHRVGIESFPDGLEPQDLLRQLLHRHDVELVEEAVRKASEQVTESARCDRVYLVIDDRALLQRFPHYLTYGGEYVLGLLVAYCEAAEQSDMRELLTRQGRPTIVIANIPVSVVTAGVLSALTLELLAGWLDHVRLRDQWPGPRLFDCCIQVPGSVPREWVVDHWHPEV